MKYVGDCIMPLCCAAGADPKGRRGWLSAGLEMHLAMYLLQPQFCSRGWAELRVRVNVNMDPLGSDWSGTQAFEAN